MSCKQCGAKFGLMIEEDGKDKICVKCHPTSMSNLLSPKENLEKVKHWDFQSERLFNRVRNMVFDEEKQWT